MTILIRSAIRALKTRIEYLENRIEAEAKDAIRRGQEAENEFLAKYTEKKVHEIYELFEEIFDLSTKYQFIEEGIQCTIDEIHKNRIQRITNKNASKKNVFEDEYEDEYDETYCEE